MQEIEQADAQQPGEAGVDDFQRRHPPADDAFLRREVVRPYARFIFGRMAFILVAGDALQQRIDFFLGEKIVCHGALRYWITNEVKNTPVTACGVPCGRKGCFTCAMISSDSFFLPSMPEISEAFLLDSRSSRRLRT